MSEHPMMSRPRSATAEYIELRVDIPVAVANVLDGESIARGAHRSTLVNEILQDWARRAHHRATMVVKLAGANPFGEESPGGAP